MTTLVLVVLAGTGTSLAYTSRAAQRRRVGTLPRGVGRVAGGVWRRIVARRDVLVFAACTAALAGLVVWTATLSPTIAAAAAMGLGSLPIAAERHRRQAVRMAAHDEWPRLVDELRVLTGSAGRSIPQAVIEAGHRAPALLRPGFEAAEREWRVTTDLDRTLAVLKEHLADAAVDATCETLLVAHEVGGSDLEHRLEELAADRRLDVQERKDARARQAGVRFARRFVLLVPIGMGAAGMAVGTGRSAYSTPIGQLLAVSGVVLVSLCWIWAGRLLRLPGSGRVFG